MNGDYVSSRSMRSGEEMEIRWGRRIGTEMVMGRTRIMKRINRKLNKGGG
jgi:hypothetical protein